MHIPVLGPPLDDKQKKIENVRLAVMFIQNICQNLPIVPRGAETSGLLSPGEVVEYALGLVEHLDSYLNAVPQTQLRQ